MYIDARSPAIILVVAAVEGEEFELACTVKQAAVIDTVMDEDDDVRFYHDGVELQALHRVVFTPGGRVKELVFEGFTDDLEYGS